VQCPDCDRLPKLQSLETSLESTVSRGSTQQGSRKESGAQVHHLSRLNGHGLYGSKSVSTCSVGQFSYHIFDNVLFSLSNEVVIALGHFLFVESAYIHKRLKYLKCTFSHGFPIFPWFPQPKNPGPAPFPGALRRRSTAPALGSPHHPGHRRRAGRTCSGASNRVTLW
jgi:hypothetical protein